MIQTFSNKYKVNLDLVENKFSESKKQIENLNKKYLSNQDFYTDIIIQMFDVLNLEKTNKNINFAKDLVENAKQNILVKIKPRDGVIDFLKYLKKQGLKIIVFSGGNQTVVDFDYRNQNSHIDYEFKKNQLENLGLYELIDELIPTSKFLSFKPEKKVFELLIQHLNCKGKECVMIGDSDVDIAANQVNMITIYLNEKNNKSKWEADYEVNDFFKIKEIITKLIEKRPL